MKVALFGGTFDPFHLGHLHLARAAKTELGLNKVIFIPAFIPPHKTDKSITPASHRLAMLRAGLLGESAFEISSHELDKRAVCYTIDTVKALYRQHPEWTEVYLLLGDDAASGFSTWKEAWALSQLVKVVVGARPGASGELPPDWNSRFLHLQNPPFHASSEEIRANIAKRQANPELLPKAVRDYIERHQLYR